MFFLVKYLKLLQSNTSTNMSTMLPQESIDLLEMMLLEKLMIIEEEKYDNLCDDCGRNNCLDDNCCGQWDDNQARDYHVDRYSINDGYHSDEGLYGSHGDDWESYWDSIYN